MDKLSVYCIYEMMECIECNEIKIIHFETRLNLMRIPITRVVDLFSKINWKIRCFSLLFSFYLFRLISFEYELSSIIRNISFHEKKSESLFQNFLIYLQQTRTFIISLIVIRWKTFSSKHGRLWLELTMKMYKHYVIINTVEIKTLKERENKDTNLFVKINN